MVPEIVKSSRVTAPTMEAVIAAGSIPQRPRRDPHQSQTSQLNHPSIISLEIDEAIGLNGNVINITPLKGGGTQYDTTVQQVTLDSGVGVIKMGYGPDITHEVRLYQALNEAPPHVQEMYPSFIGAEPTEDQPGFVGTPKLEGPDGRTAIKEQLLEPWQIRYIFDKTMRGNIMWWESASERRGFPRHSMQRIERPQVLITAKKKADLLASVLIDNTSDTQKNDSPTHFDRSFEQEGFESVEGQIVWHAPLGIVSADPETGEQYIKMLPSLYELNADQDDRLENRMVRVAKGNGDTSFKNTKITDLETAETRLFDLGYGGREDDSIGIGEVYLITGKGLALSYAEPIKEGDIIARKSKNCALIEKMDIWQTTGAFTLQDHAGENVRRYAREVNMSQEELAIDILDAYIRAQMYDFANSHEKSNEPKAALYSWKLAGQAYLLRKDIEVGKTTIDNWREYFMF